MKITQLLTAVATAGALALFMGGSAGAVTLNTMNGSEPGSIDPHKASGDWENRIIGDYIEGLVAEDANADAIPGQAESWDISEDGKTYTFFLRTNAIWSTGEPITSHDFVYSWFRVLEPATASDYVGNLFYIQQLRLPVFTNCLLGDQPPDAGHVAGAFLDIVDAVELGDLDGCRHRHIGAHRHHGALARIVECRARSGHGRYIRATAAAAHALAVSRNTQRPPRARRDADEPVGQHVGAG